MIQLDPRLLAATTKLAITRDLEDAVIRATAEINDLQRAGVPDNANDLAVLHEQAQLLADTTHTLRQLRTT